MPRVKSVEIMNNFAQGLVTEATGLNFPENACTETDNCKFDYKGVVTRRLGMDYEAGYELDGLTKDDSVITEYVWTAPRGDGTKTYVVIQVGNIIRFYEEDVDGPLSPGMESWSIDLDSFDITGNPGTKTAPCQYSSGKGYLFIFHPYCDPIYVSLASDYTSATGTAITVKIRDFDGLASTSTYPDFTTRPTSTRAALDDFDEYNLLNQGWGRTVLDDAGNSVVALDEWDSNNTTMPALGDTWYLFATADAATRYDYRSTAVDAHPPPNSRSSYGRFILDAFLQARDVPSGIAGLSDDDVTSSYFRPRTGAFYAGRVFYGGVDAQGFNNSIYFSQIIETDSQFGLCYQVNDPTSEEITDLLPSDGGVIKILDVANIIKLFVMGPRLLVFATNGVWAISGSSTDGLGFAANDYTISKISSVGAISSYSFVDVEGVPIWWNREGIWTIVADQGGALQVQSLSRTTIHTYFNEIPVESKFYAKGAYNRTERIVQWLFESDEVTDVDDKHTYDTILNLNVQTSAFYPWSIDTGVGVKLSGIVSCRGSNDSGVQAAVTDSGADVTDESGEVVTVLEFTSQAYAQTFRYLVNVLDSGTTFNFTWATERDEAYVDWDTHGTAADYDSYFITGYNIIGQAQRFGQANYVFVYLNQEDDSSCFFQSIWDFATSSAGGRFSNAQQVYRDTQLNQGVSVARVKTRGKGRARQFKFYSEAGKPFNIIGWSTWSTQTTDP